MKIVLFVEGDTESKSVDRLFKRWLDRRLDPPIGLKVVNVKGASKYLSEIPRRVATYLVGKTGRDVVAAVGLLDLYGLQYPPHLQNVEDRFHWAKDSIEKDVGHPKFTQWFAVHEVEAWLLAHPSVLPKAVARALPKKCARPETVNFNNPPAALLDRLFRSKVERTYRKTIDGRRLFAELDPEVAYEKCPYLARMLDHMLDAARAAGL